MAAYLASWTFQGSTPRHRRLKTAAFWDIVDGSRAPEDAELADMLDALASPTPATLANRSRKTSGTEDLSEWLKGPPEPARYPAPAGALRVRAGRATTPLTMALWIIQESGRSFTPRRA